MERIILQKKVYICAKGKVYDVTKSGFYGIGGPYHIFAGHEASVNLAKNSFDEKLLDTCEVSKLSFSERDTLAGFCQQYEMKYDEIGWLKEYKDKNGLEDEEEDKNLMFKKWI